MASDVTLFVETNLEWREKDVLTTAQEAANATLSSARLITSSNETAWDCTLKHRGTMTCVIGNTTGRILEMEEDKSGLGRWSKTRLIGRGEKFLSIYGAYRVASNSKPGPSTAQFQQQMLLMAMTELGGSTDPRTRFIDDLIQAVNDDRAQGNEVVIGLDANAVLFDDTRGLNRLVRECGLFDLAAAIPEHHDPPGTYDQSG